eukprot:901-Rhodomonas_salina.2
MHCCQGGSAALSPSESALLGLALCLALLAALALAALGRALLLAAWRAQAVSRHERRASPRHKDRTQRHNVRIVTAARGRDDDGMSRQHRHHHDDIATRRSPSQAAHAALPAGAPTCLQACRKLTAERAA